MKNATSALAALAALVPAVCSLTAGIARPAYGQTIADPSNPVEDEIVVSAGLTEIARKRVGSSITVIDREEIERKNKSTVLELLRTVPGLEVSQSGGPGKVTSVFIRGGNSSHTLVAVDGVRVNGNTSGAFDFSDLTADNLERIEIVRGPQGLIFGSEAVAGAINIITRRGDGPVKGWIRGAGGSDGYSQFSAGVRGGDDRLHYSVSAARLSTDGVSAAEEDNGNTEDDPWRNLAVSGRLGGEVWGDGSLELTLRYTAGKTDVDGFTFGIGPTDDLNAEQERDMFTGSLSLRKPVTDRWTQTVTLAHHRDDLESIDPDNPFGNFQILSETAELSTQADFDLGRGDTLSVGYKVEDREAENPGSFAESVTLRSVFVEGLWSLGEAVDLSLGARNDDHSIFGDETTYRLALAARLGDRSRLHGSFGTGFKAPTFNDLYFPGFGNLDLRPETSQGFDLGWELSFAGGRAVVDATYFDTAFEDLILFSFPSGFINVAEAESSGVELTFDWQAGDHLLVQASHTYNETEDLATGKPLARRPEQRTTLGLSFDWLQRWTGNASVIAVADRIDADGSEMDDYERVDLSVEYRLNDRFRPFARVENLFDEDYSEIPGFTTPGITWIAGAHLSF